MYKPNITNTNYVFFSLVNIVNEIAEAKDRYTSAENYLHKSLSPDNDHLIAKENIVIGSSTEATSDENLVTSKVFHSINSNLK